MFSQDVYNKAFTYATKAYNNQKKVEEFEYLEHITAVVNEVIYACEKSKLDEEKANLAVSCALLHNIIDDTNITYDDLYVDFSDAIANSVEALSKDKTLKTKQEQLKKSIEMLLEQPYEVQMVKLADLITNVSTPLKEASFILSCLKNSNIYLSAKLEENLEYRKSNKI